MNTRYPKHIAVVGAGLAGLAVCWHLMQLDPGLRISLFDPKGIGGGASGIATGLLHPFVGRRAIQSWRSDEGMEETEKLIAVSEKAMQRPVAEKTGIFRPAITEQQQRDFRKSKAEWKEDPRFGPGLWIPNGITVYSRLYLQGLWASCENLGVQLSSERIASLDQLQSFDRIVLAAGFETVDFDLCKHLDLKSTKGQTLLCRWKTRLPFSLVSQGHITPTENPDLCQIGSTYERHYEHLNPDPEICLELKEKAAQFYEPARQFETVEIRAAVRISKPKGYRPIAQKMDEKTWVFTGLGSRGLLYHGLIGKALAASILQDIPVV